MSCTAFWEARAAGKTATCSRQRLEHHEQIPRAMAFVLIVDALRASGCRRERRADLLYQWLDPFIKSDQRLLRVIRSLRHLQGVFYRTDERDVRLRRNDGSALGARGHTSHAVALGTIAGMADVRISSLNVATSASMTSCNWLSCWSMRVER